jgi:hypothetical protein
MRVNREAIGAIGEVLGAAAMVATLVYVSRQIREQNRPLQTNTRDSAFHQLQERSLEHRRPTFDPRFLAFIDNMGEPTMPSGAELSRWS